MVDKPQQPPESEELFYLSLQELTYSFGVNEQTIIEIIDEGIISAHKNAENEWQFNNEAYRRIKTVLHLHNDLNVNIAGAALALELMSEIERLHRLLKLS